MTKSTAFVAIHCLVYNHEPYLRDCLEGFVMQQTNFPFVAIVHDDASTDSSAAIIREYEEKYPDIIKPIYETENQYSKRNGSLGRIMNAAIDATGAKYVAFCEGDDYWTDPLKLQKQVDFMEVNPEYGLCYTDYNLYNGEGDVLKESCFVKSGKKIILTFEEHLFYQGYIAPMTWLYRRDLYNSFRDEMLKGVLDGTYVIALEFFARSKVAFMPITTAVHITHQGSASKPNSLAGIFKYRKSVYDTGVEYAKRYTNNQWYISFIRHQEINELYPIAVKLNYTDYIKWCREIDQEDSLIQLFIPQRIINLQSSRAYRLGKFLLKPFSWGRNLLKPNK